MTTIYIVTSGEYSDYTINAVFDSKEKAEAYIAYEKQHNTYSVYDRGIEEWTLNEYADPISRGLTCFRVMFRDIRKGDAEAEIHNASGESEHSNTNHRTHVRNYWTYVWAQDEQAALKIANERRVRYLLRLEQEEMIQP